MTDVSVGRRPHVTGGISAAIASAIQHPRPVTADPAPLGLGAVALTTFVLSMMNSALGSVAGSAAVLGRAVASAGAEQRLGRMWGFRTGCRCGATAFAAYGGLCIGQSVLVQFDAASRPSADAGGSIGLYLIAWGIFTAYMFV